MGSVDIRDSVLYRCGVQTRSLCERPSLCPALMPPMKFPPRPLSSRLRCDLRVISSEAGGADLPVQVIDTSVQQELEDRC